MSKTARIVHETPMPNVGDELHHFGWNRCSSACHGPDRSHLIVPGFRSSRIHIVNVADDPRAPRIEKVIEPQELVEKTGYTRPHTVHCMPGDDGRYGQRLHFWNLAERRLEQTIDLGEQGCCRSSCAGCTTPTPTAASSGRPSRATSFASTARTAASGPSR
jgi:56kDa selenium binding protein (SBP56)